MKVLLEIKLLFKQFKEEIKNIIKNNIIIQNKVTLSIVI
jgi:hypothetical protein